MGWCLTQIDTGVLCTTQRLGIGYIYGGAQGVPPRDWELGTHMVGHRVLARGARASTLLTACKKMTEGRQEQEQQEQQEQEEEEEEEKERSSQASK